MSSRLPGLPAMSEQELQAQTAKFLRLQYRGLLFWHTPNGGRRNAIEAAIFQGLGVLAGVADWAFVLPGGRAAFIELKSESGELSGDQVRFRELVVGLGAPYAVARSLEEFQGILREWKDQGLLQSAEVRGRRNYNGSQFPWGTLVAALADHVRAYVDPQLWTLADADRLEALAGEVRRRAEFAAGERRRFEPAAAPCATFDDERTPEE